MKLYESTGDLHSIRFNTRLELISTTPRTVETTEHSNNDNTYGPIVSSSDGSKPKAPLVIMLAWLASRKRHTMKFVRLYTDQGFDVLLLTTPPASLVQPIVALKGGAKILWNFYNSNQDTYASVTVHGFSVGACVWGLFLEKINRRPVHHGMLQDRIKGQVWDSPFVNIEQFAKVGGETVFPHNNIARKVAEKYGEIITTVFHNPGFEAADAFQFRNFNNVYLVYASEVDKASPSHTVTACAEQWRRNGCTVYWKMWEKSEHVCHMKQHPEEYKLLLKGFLDRIGLLRCHEKFQY